MNSKLAIMMVICVLASLSYADDLSDCGTLATAGTTYTLLQNISNLTNTCLTVTGENITIDCAGFTILGGNESGAHGIYTTVRNTTVMNCIIENVSIGVYFSLCDYGTVTNTTINSTRTLSGANGMGIYITNSDYNSISDTTVSANRGIYIYANSDYNSLNRVTSTSIANYGAIHISLNNNHNSIYNSSGMAASSSGGNAIYVDGSTNITMDNVTGNSTEGYGLYLLNMDIGNVDNCYGYGGAGSSDYGFVVSNISNFSIDNSGGVAVSAAGMRYIYLYDSIISNSYGMSTSGSGFLVLRSNNNTFNNITGESSSSYGINFNTNINNSIVNTCRGISGTGTALQFATNTNYNLSLDNCYLQAGYGGGGISVLFIGTTSYNLTLSNSILNGSFKLYLSAPPGEVESACSHTFSNVTDQNGLPIVYLANTPNTLIENQSYSAFFLCNSSNTTMNNITTNSQSMLIRTNNSLISNWTVLSNNTFNPDYTNGFASYSSDNNLFSDLDIFALARPFNLYDSDNNSVISSSIRSERSNIGFEFNINSVNNTIANSSIRANGSYTAYFYSTSSENRMINNTLINDQGYALIYVANESSGNFIYLNNFTDNSGLYVNDTNGSNYYNATYNGKNQGNIWPNVINGSVWIAGNVNSDVSGYYIGNSGSGYPYNSSNSQDKVVGCVDYAPLTPTYGTCTYPGSGNWYVVPSDNCNVTVNYNLAGSSLYINGTSGTTTFTSNITNIGFLHIANGTVRLIGGKLNVN